MVREWHVKLILTLSFILMVMAGFSQNRLMYRFAANSGMFLNEENPLNNPDPSIIGNITPGGINEFKSELKVGFEFEVSVPVGELFSIGLEFEVGTMKGINENPIYYNYFATQTDLFTYDQQPLMYTTYQNNLLGNLRYYPLKTNRFQPFMKVFGGVSFVGTSLQFSEAVNQSTIFNPLYSRGTKFSTETRWPAFYYGIGLGFEYPVSEFISLYMDASFSVVETDIVDGIPNFTYNDIIKENEHVSTNSFTGQVSIGFCYKLFNQTQSSKEKGSKRATFKKRKGRIDKYFPFHEIKR